MKNIKIILQNQRMILKELESKVDGKWLSVPLDLVVVILLHLLPLEHALQLFLICR